MKMYGNYRAKVVDNKDPDKFGRVKVWIPDVMPDIEQTKGEWARPANNPIGGRNAEEGTSGAQYMGSSFIPGKGSWIWIFFEAGNINRPYYFGALDLENTKVLPENQVGGEYQDKWTIFKSRNGRCIVISDDTDDERVEITGKKSSISSPPSGDTSSVYTIDGNQNTILLDERTGKEKILMRSFNGDFFHFDIEERELHISFENDVIIKSNSGNVYLQGKAVSVKADESVSIEGGNEINVLSDDKIKITSTADMNIKSSGIFNIQGSLINIIGVLKGPLPIPSSAVAEDASGADTKEPEGDRDT